MLQDLNTIPAWLVSHSDFVIDAEKLFRFLYKEEGHFRNYQAFFPCMQTVGKITTFGESLSGYVYTLNGSPVLTLKGAEYVAMHGAGQMEYERFAKFFHFVGDWKKTRVPGTKNVNMYAVKIMEPSAPEAPRDPKEEPKPTAEAQKPTMDSPKPTMETQKPTMDSMEAPTLRQVMTASTLGSGDTLPGLFKSLLDEYIEMRREFSDERERKDRLIDDLMRKILAK